MNMGVERHQRGVKPPPHDKSSTDQEKNTITRMHFIQELSHCWDAHPFALRLKNGSATAWLVAKMCFGTTYVWRLTKGRIFEISEIRNKSPDSAARDAMDTRFLSDNVAIGLHSVINLLDTVY